MDKGGSDSGGPQETTVRNKPASTRLSIYGLFPFLEIMIWTEELRPHKNDYNVAVGQLKETVLNLKNRLYLLQRMLVQVLPKLKERSSENAAKMEKVKNEFESACKSWTAFFTAAKDAQCLSDETTSLVLFRQSLNDMSTCWG